MKSLIRILETTLSLIPTRLMREVQFEIDQGARFERLTFPESGPQSFHLIQFLKASNGAGPEIAGLGCDQNEATAYRRAIFEYYERKAVLLSDADSGLESTNGVAAHRYLPLAKRASFFELAERDAFLRHWYQRIPMRELLTGESRAVGKVASLLEGTPNLTLRFGQTTLGVEACTAAFLQDSRSGGFALGLSCGRGHEGDVEKAAIEALVNYYFGNHGKTDRELLDQVQSNGVKTLSDHRTFWLLMRGFPDWIFSSSKTSDFDQRIPSPKVSYQVLNLQPVRVVAASSESMLKLTIGDSRTSIAEQIEKTGLRPPAFYDEWIHPIP